jgi:SAM-dependent methyltransferase
MKLTHFDQRRALNEPIGLARNLDRHSIWTTEHLNLLEEPGVTSLLETDETPIPHPDDREGYYDDRHVEYWLSGYADFRKIKPFLDAAESPKRYLDMGGATGRVIRHAIRMDGLECWLSDINVNRIDWVNRYFKADVVAYQSRIAPSIPAPDNHFTLISAFSVFTHLDNDEMQWLLELKRVLKPGGYLYLTIMDEHVWDKLKDPNWRWLRDSISGGVREAELAELVRGPMPGERFVWTYSDLESYNINTFLRSDYVKRHWGKLFRSCDYRPGGHGFQTVVVLQK